MSPNGIITATTSRLGTTANCGFKLETSIDNEDKAEIIVTAGWLQTISGDTKLTVYLVEDKVPQISQQGTNNPNYIHDQVVRQVLTPYLGEAIDMNQKAMDQKSFSFSNIDLTDYKKDDLQAVAFITRYGNDFTESEVLNVQWVKLGENIGWE